MTSKCSWKRRASLPAISAEDFCAGALCNEEGPCCPIPVEDRFPCHPIPPAQTKVCCCKQAMTDALRLLCDPALTELVDFDSFFFLTDSLTVGGGIGAPSQTSADNIISANAAFHRFSPCNCDLLEVDGAAYFATPISPVVALLDVEQLSICALKAAAFQLAAPEEPGDADADYRRAVRAIRRGLDAMGGDTYGCAACQAHCDCDDCCCTEGLLAELSTRNLSRLATLAVGPLVLQNVSVLGSLGSALILADETQRRFYLVCAQAIEVLA